MQRTHQEVAWHPRPGSAEPDGPKACTPPRRPGTSAGPSPPSPAWRAGAIRGRVLDAGCGNGEHAFMAAGPGPDATGVDLAASALRAPEQKARDRGLTAPFVRWDALRLAELRESFDTVLGCELFHLVGDDDRAARAAGLRAWLGALTRT